MLTRLLALLTILLLAACAPTASGIRYAEYPLYKIYTDTHAKIVVFRPNSGAGSGEGLEIMLNDVTKALVLKGGFSIIDAEPGKHVLQTKSRTIDLKKKVTLGRGETLFFKVDFNNYALTGTWQLVELDEKTVKKEYQEYRSSN